MPNNLQQLRKLTDELESKVSFKGYLLLENYQMISPRLFVKDDTPEIIRLTKKGGRTVFKNFLVREDKGTLIDFICHRSGEKGRVTPDRNEFSLEGAINKVRLLLGSAATAVKPLNKHSRQISDDRSSAIRL